MVLSLQIMLPVAARIEADLSGHITKVPEDSIDGARAILKVGWAHLADFLEANSQPADVSRIVERVRGEAHVSVDPRDPRILIPAFLLGELREAFILGFVVSLPFLIVDLVVANILMALGLQMMAPTTLSIPLKILLFLSVDGWHLLGERLVGGYST
ncbi:MAG: flagellar biosynthetic protein FliP [Myxococcales bacterium]|nr:flagellar biosynthetic protein FliP [Myxococcales bacterium]